MKKSLISSLIAVAILCSGSTVAFASPQNTNSKQNVTVDKQEAIDKNVEYNHDQLMYSIEEMKRATNLLDNSDLTNDQNYYDMSLYCKKSIDRLRSLDIYKNNETWVKNYKWAKVSSPDIVWLKNSNEQISKCLSSVNKILQAMDNIEELFESENNSNDLKASINKLSQVLNQEKDNVNKKTLKSAQNFLNNYIDIFSGKQSKIDKTVEYNYKQLNYSIKEMAKSNDLLDNADLTNDNNYYNLSFYCKQSMDRLRSLDIYKDTKNWIVNYKSWAANVPSDINWLEESNSRISKCLNNVNKILQAMDNVDEVFESNGSVNNKKIVLNELNTILNKQEQEEVVNSATLNSATKFMDHYKDLIK